MASKAPTQSTGLRDGLSSSNQNSSRNLLVESSSLSVVNDKGVHYQTGYGNTFESECLAGALPIGRNNPRQVPYNLYAEQLSGTAFTAPRRENQRTWLYRVQPSVVLGGGDAGGISSSSATSSSVGGGHAEGPQSTLRYFGGMDPTTQCETCANPLRWKPLPEQDASTSKPNTDFVSGMRLVCAAGDPSVKSGLAIYQYSCRSSMNTTQQHLYNADGEFLVVPQQGSLEVCTELGRLVVHPTEIVVIPRGIVFQVNLLLGNSSGSAEQQQQQQQQAGSTSDRALGYVLEVYQGSFQLPELGPIGSNGLANPRDFYYPTAWCKTTRKDYQQACTIHCKMHSKLLTKQSEHSPFNVVAWHGNYLPYKYDLKRFCVINSVSYDHLDPSIYTVLTCPSDHAGTALADFVIFPPRVMATDSNTLRPPWFHRNTMSEYMGLIEGMYDAKQEQGGFVPGGASLHNCMTPHGPDTASYQAGVADECTAPVQFTGGLAFMFETCLSLKVAPTALRDEAWRDMRYAECWQELADQFTGWEMLKEQADGKQKEA